MDLLICCELNCEFKSRFCVWEYNFNFEDMKLEDNFTQSDIFPDKLIWEIYKKPFQQILKIMILILKRQPRLVILCLLGCEFYLHVVSWFMICWSRYFLIVYHFIK